MVKITVKYFALVRDVTKTKEDALDVGDKATIHNVIARLCGVYGEPFEKSFCTADGYLQEGLILLLNGEAVTRDYFKSLTVKDGDIIAIMPPVGGG